MRGSGGAVPLPEARTVQFLVERPCPENGNGVRAKDLMPLVIWVFWPPEPNYLHDCSAAKVFRHDPNSELPPLVKAGNPGHCVCEHMGHVIE